MPADDSGALVSLAAHEDKGYQKPTSHDSRRPTASQELIHSVCISSFSIDCSYRLDQINKRYSVFSLTL